MVGLALVTTRFRVKKVVILRAAPLATVHRPVGRAIHAIGFGPADQLPVGANRLLALSAVRDRGIGTARVLRNARAIQAGLLAVSAADPVPVRADRLFALIAVPLAWAAFAPERARPVAAGLLAVGDADPIPVNANGLFALLAKLDEPVALLRLLVVMLTVALAFVLALTRSLQLLVHIPLCLRPLLVLGLRPLLLGLGRFNDVRRSETCGHTAQRATEERPSECAQRVTTGA